MTDKDIQTKYHNPQSKNKEWCCAYYKKVYLTSRSTSGHLRHLVEYYKVRDRSVWGVKVQNIQKSIEQAFATAEANPVKRRCLDANIVQQDKLETLWVHTVVSCYLSFRLVENLEFCAFIRYLNKDAKQLFA